MNETLDFGAYEARCKGMQTHQLESDLVMLNDALPGVDALDRVNDTNRGGYYRDQASVIRAELRTRSMEICRRDAVLGRMTTEWTNRIRNAFGLASDGKLSDLVYEALLDAFDAGASEKR